MKTTGLPASELSRFQQLGASAAWQGVWTLLLPLWLLLQMAWQRGEHICPRGPPEAYVCSVLPTSPPLLHACIPGLQVSTLHPLSGPWPVCQLQSPQLASSGRRANIYSSEAHRGPHRRTRDWCELATHPNRGLSLIFNQAPGFGQRLSQVSLVYAVVWASCVILRVTLIYK